MKSTFHSLKIETITQETKDAISIQFHIPQELKKDYEFTQGQYITLRFFINDKEHRRAYSMCNSPLEGGIKVTVKRISNGLISNFINNNLKVGDYVEVMTPQGKFFNTLDASKTRQYYLFAGGSGITPLLSIAKTVLETEVKSKVCLFYGNNDEDSIIFKDVLESMSNKYNGQFVVEHILQNPIQHKKSGISGFFGAKNIHWNGLIGVPDANQVNRFLQRNFSDSESFYFVCGPSAMMNGIEQLLTNQNIEKSKIFLERFSSIGAETKPITVSATTNVGVVVHLDKKTIDVQLEGTETILEALIRMKKNPPFSCMSGSCSTCMAKLKQGTVKMDSCFVLDEEEINSGLILVCQSRPTSEFVEISFDEVQ